MNKAHWKSFKHYTEEMENEPEEGEIIDNYEVISSDEEFTMRQRIEELEAKNKELEQIAVISRGYTNNYRYPPPPIFDYYNYNRKEEYWHDKKYPNNRVAAIPSDVSSISSTDFITPTISVKHRKIKVNRKKHLRSHHHCKRNSKRHRNCHHHHTNSNKSKQDKNLICAVESLSAGGKSDSIHSLTNNTDNDFVRSEIDRNNLHLAVARHKHKKQKKCSLRERLLNHEKYENKSEAVSKGELINVEDDPQIQAIEDVDSSDSLEEKELRLIALKSAVLRKHVKRKKRNAESAYSPTDFDEMLISGILNTDDVEAELEGEDTQTSDLINSPVASPKLLLSPLPDMDEDDGENSQAASTVVLPAVDTKPVDMDISDSDTEEMIACVNKWCGDLAQLTPPPPPPLLMHAPYDCNQRSTNYPYNLCKPDLKLEPLPPGVEYEDMPTPVEQHASPLPEENLSVQEMELENPETETVDEQDTPQQQQQQHIKIESEKATSSCEDEEELALRALLLAKIQTPRGRKRTATMDRENREIIKKSKIKTESTAETILKEAVRRFKFHAPQQKQRQQQPHNKENIRILNESNAAKTVTKCKRVKQTITTKKTKTNNNKDRPTMELANTPDHTDKQISEYPEIVDLTLEDDDEEEEPSGGDSDENTAQNAEHVSEAITNNCKTPGTAELIANITSGEENLADQPNQTILECNAFNKTNQVEVMSLTEEKMSTPTHELNVTVKTENILSEESETILKPEEKILDNQGKTGSSSSDEGDPKEHPLIHEQEEPLIESNEDNLQRKEDCNQQFLDRADLKENSIMLPEVIERTFEENQDMSAVIPSGGHIKENEKNDVTYEIINVGIKDKLQENTLDSHTVKMSKDETKVIKDLPPSPVFSEKEKQVNNQAQNVSEIKVTNKEEEKFSSQVTEIPTTNKGREKPTNALKASAPLSNAKALKKPQPQSSQIKVITQKRKPSDHLKDPPSRKVVTKTQTNAKQLTATPASVTTQRLATYSVLRTRKIVKPNKVINKSIVEMPAKANNKVEKTAATIKVKLSTTAQATERLVTLQESSKIQVSPLVINLQDQSSDSFQSEDDDGNDDGRLPPYYDNASPISLNMESPLGDSPLRANSPIERNLSADRQQQQQFEEKLETFLKSVRSKVQQQDVQEAATATATRPPAQVAKSTGSSNQTPQAVRHLPVAAQEEYRRLIRRMKMLENQRKACKGEEIKTKKSTNSQPTPTNNLCKKVLLKNATNSTDMNKTSTQPTTNVEILTTYENQFHKIGSDIVNNLSKSLKLVSDAKQHKLNKMTLERRMQQLMAEFNSLQMQHKAEEQKIKQIFPIIGKANEVIIGMKRKRSHIFKMALSLGKTVHGENYSINNESRENITQKTKQLADEIKIVNSLKVQDIKEKPNLLEGKVSKPTKISNQDNNPIVEEIKKKQEEEVEEEEGELETEVKETSATSQTASCSYQLEMEGISELQNVEEKTQTASIEAQPEIKVNATDNQEDVKETDMDEDKFSAETAARVIKEYDSPLDHIRNINSSVDSQGVLCPYDLMGHCEDTNCTYVHLTEQP